MSNQKDHIPQEPYPERILLSGEWDELSDADRGALLTLGIDREEFTSMRDLLLVAGEPSTRVDNLRAPDRVHKELDALFDRVHGGGARPGKVIPMKRKRLLLTGVAAALALLLMAGAIALIVRSSDHDAQGTGDRFAQHQSDTLHNEKGDERKGSPQRETADQPTLPVDPETHQQPSPHEPLISLAKVTPKKAENEEDTPASLLATAPPARQTMEEYTTWNDQSAESTLTMTETFAWNEVAEVDAVARKSVAGIRTEAVTLSEPKASKTPAPKTRPASQDAALFRFLYACQ